MRKLSAPEHSALLVISRRGSYCPGDLSGAGAAELRAALNGLVRKGYATAAATDDGPAYSLTFAGEREAGQ
jgi:hypothetical protein